MIQNIAFPPRVFPKLACKSLGEGHMERGVRAFIHSGLLTRVSSGKDFALNLRFFVSEMSELS